MAYIRSKTAPAKADIYERVTASIVAALEAGTRPWTRPWGASGAPSSAAIRPLRVNGTAYRGINTVMLWGEAWSKGYSNPTWMTFQQAKEFNANVRRGEHGSLVVYANRFTKTETTPDGIDVERSIPFLKGYTVFNCEQIDGLPERFNVTKPEIVPVPATVFDRNEIAESFVSNTGANVAHGGDKAFFIHAPADRIQMPPVAAFRDAPSYYATLLHELTHWCDLGETRINRPNNRKRWGDEHYALSELVAELGAAFLCADLGVSNQPREDHSSYIASWLKVLKNDKRAIFSAASYAQASCDYLHAMQPGAIVQNDEGEEPTLALAA